MTAALARVAGQLGALDDRLRRGLPGWRHRLALIEAAELSWISGDRISEDRLGLWISMRVTGVNTDQAGLSRASWAFRRLCEGPPPEDDLGAFLGRHDPVGDRPDIGLEGPEFESFSDRSDAWSDLMSSGADLHPITRACMGYHSWALAGLGRLEGRVEAGVTAARIAASECAGAVFAPIATGGSAGLRSSGSVEARLSGWIEGMEQGIRTSMRHLDDIEDWGHRAGGMMAGLSGRTPFLIRDLLIEWPVISAPMAEEITGASRPAVQRNLRWMEERSLIREITGQGRFRMWRAAA